jgi:tetratricopeptide (TPR) repeat protein
MDQRDFFVSYNKEDLEWASWIAWTLEEAEYTVVFQAWDFRPGQNFVLKMQEATTLAERTLFVLSKHSLNAEYTHSEWAAAFAQDPRGAERLLIPVRVGPCAPKGLLSQIVYIDLVGQGSEETAKAVLLGGLKERAKPETRPHFPGHSFPVTTRSVKSLGPKERTFSKPVEFPGKGPTISLTHLPTGTENFVGREVELKKLDEAWAAGEQVNVLSLVAFGGVGKTALMNAWLKSLRQRDWVGAERVFGWSFYSQGTRDAPASADPFFEKIFPWLGLAAEAIPSDGETKGETLAALLTRQRTLLILDGLEPLQQAPAEKGSDGRIQDPGLAALLRSLVFKNPGLCLITTRVPLTETADYADSTAPRIDLERLGPKAGVALLERYGVQGLAAEKNQAVEALGGHALALTLAGTYLRDFAGGEIGKLKEVPVLTDDTEPGQHARRMMAAYARRLGERERSILRLLGLFDRPAGEDVLRVLRAEPAIPGLTEGLTLQDEVAWKHALLPLRNARLIVEEDGGFTARPTLDAHPLVRDYFGRRLRDSHPDAWREANDRLYRWYQSQAPDQPDTLDAMLPLYQAVVHGCRAGKHQEALDAVFWRRIQRGSPPYSIHQLGAFTSNLVALAALFERPWDRPAPGLQPAAQAFLLNEAAFTLRAVGRLREAVEPMRVSMEMDEERGEAKGAAVSASNLSELLLTLGDVAEAVTVGRRAVKMAEASGDLFQRMGNRAVLADALHQVGKREEAAALFAAAEVLQKEDQPEYPRLYSLQGYRYCDLLLGDAPDREAAEAVRERAEYGLEIVLKGSRNHLDISLNHLTLGRAAFHLALLGDEDFTVTTGELDAAVAGLRQAGTIHRLPWGLLARARLYRELKEWDKAARDLEEVRSIAERGSMRLHLADYHLEAREVALARGESEKAREHEGKARELIAATGYGRRALPPSLPLSQGARGTFGGHGWPDGGFWKPLSLWERGWGEGGEGDFQKAQMNR